MIPDKNVTMRSYYQMVCGDDMMGQIHKGGAEKVEYTTYSISYRSMKWNVGHRFLRHVFRCKKTQFNRMLCHMTHSFVCVFFQTLHYVNIHWYLERVTHWSLLSLWDISLEIAENKWKLLICFETSSIVIQCLEKALREDFRPIH